MPIWVVSCELDCASGLVLLRCKDKEIEIISGC